LQFCRKMLGLDKKQKWRTLANCEDSVHGEITSQVTLGGASICRT
jgi:hypothetical protein